MAAKLVANRGALEVEPAPSFPQAGAVRLDRFAETSTANQLALVDTVRQTPEQAMERRDRPRPCRSRSRSSAAVPALLTADCGRYR
jgi:hypothetical protein